MLYPSLVFIVTGLVLVSVNIFIDGFPPVSHCDVAIFNDFSEEYLFDTSYNNAYFKEASVASSSFDGYVDTFANRLRIIINDGESDSIIYEP